MCERRDGEQHFAYSEGAFIDVGSAAQLPPGTTMRVTVGAADFTLANVAGRVIAVADLCLRCSRSLSTAPIADGLLVCQACGWKYDVERGCVDGLPHLRIEMHDVVVEGGRLLVASAIATPAPHP